MEPKIKAPRNPPYHKMMGIDTIKVSDEDENEDELTEDEKRRRELEAILRKHYSLVKKGPMSRNRTEAELIALDEAWESLD